MIAYATIKGGSCGCQGQSVFEIVGDGATTSFPITHGLNSKELLVNVRQSTTPFGKVEIPYAFTSNSVVTFTFVVAPAVGTVYTVMMYRVSNSYSIVGDGSTTAFTFTHNLGSRNLITSIRQGETPFSAVDVPTTFPTVNTVTVTFAVAPGSGVTYRLNLIPLC